MEYQYRPTDMMGADMDLVLAIHHLKLAHPFAVKSRHVYVHQDWERKEKIVTSTTQKEHDQGEET